MTVVEVFLKVGREIQKYLTDPVGIDLSGLTPSQYKQALIKT